MIKNLEVNNNSAKNIDKILIHKIIGLLKKEFNFNVSSLLINFVSANQIKKINIDFLNHNYSTDIITFDYSEKKLVIDSEIYISVDDAEYNAKRFNVSFFEEILRLVIHGILHLLGYDDMNSNAKREMKKIEDKLFEKYAKILLSGKRNKILEN